MPELSVPQRPYPVDRVADVALRDGSTVRIRPVSSDDAAEIMTFLNGMSADSLAFRFFSVPNLNWVASWSVDVDYVDRYALVAESAGRIIAHGAYIRNGGESAEVAFLVANAWQGRGISTIMLAHLAEAAAERGITRFVAEVLPSNHRMIDVFRLSGFPMELRSSPDVIEIELPTSLAPEAVAQFEARERVATVAAVRGFLAPRSLAVIGASRRRGTIGGELLHNVISGGFTGEVYAVNPNAEAVQSLPAYTSIADVPGPVDLAVIVVAAATVVDVARRCATSGVRSLLVISAGFAETGEAGARRQAELLEVCRESGMRLVGPNCLGLVNTDADVALNATFAPRPPASGRVGFLSQSGGVGIAIIEAAAGLGVGLSSFVSVGNKVDLSSNDFLEYWEQDDQTDLALLYLESFGNPRKFARVARRFSRTKPLLAVKSGRSPAGRRATSSHTGALLAASDVTIDALFHQAGVIRADTLGDLFDVAALLAAQPLPRGERIAIITNGGGPGIICADACQAHGVQVPELPAPVVDGLRAALPHAAALTNPIDLVASATAADYAAAMRAVVDAAVCDAIIAIFVPPLVTGASDVAAAVADVAQSAGDVTISAVFMTREEAPAQLRERPVQVPAFRYPEDAARAVALAARHGQWRAVPDGVRRPPAGCHAGEAAAIISHALAQESEWLAPDLVVRLLRCYGLPVIDTRFAADAPAAAAAASELGLPVALKAVATDVVHKSDVGGVVLGLGDPAAVQAAAADVERAVARAGHRLEGFAVQPMVTPGVEIIVGMVHDHSFGPVLACGAGGATAELLKDVAIGLSPISDREAAEMIRSLKTFPLLDGYRGAARCDVAALEDVLLRVDAMVQTHAEILELDCNPVVMGPDGAVVIDARVRVGSAERVPPMPSVGA